MRKFILLAACMAGCATPDPEPGIHERAWLDTAPRCIAVLDVYDGSRLVDPGQLQLALADELSSKGFTSDGRADRRPAGRAWSDGDAAIAAQKRQVDAVVVCDVRRDDMDEDRPVDKESVYLQTGPEGGDRRQYYQGGASDPFDRGPRIRAKLRIIRADGKVVYETAFTTESMGQSESGLAKILLKPVKLQGK